MEVSAHPTHPDLVILHIAQCPRIFQRLTSASFGNAMKYEPESQGFVMSRTTYQTMYHHLAHAASLLDFKKDMACVDLVDTPAPPPTPIQPQPERTLPSVCTRSIWTQTETQMQQTNATQTTTEKNVPPNPPRSERELTRHAKQGEGVIPATIVPMDQAILNQWQDEMDPTGPTVTKSLKSKQQTMYGDMNESRDATEMGDGPSPIESGLLRTTLPVLGDERMSRSPNVPIDPYPSSLVDETRQTIFSGCSNFQQMYDHRKEVCMFLVHNAPAFTG